MKVIVNENEGKATLKEKFLGFIPYRRIGKDMANKYSPKLMISCNVDGKRRVMWGKQASRGEVAGTKEEAHCLGQVVKQPNSLVQVGPEETFSSPFHFEWGKTSTSLNKPMQVWVPKSKEAKSILGGPTTKTIPAHSIITVHDVVADLDSRTSSWDATPVAPIFKQESTFLLLRTTSTCDTRQSLHVQYFVGINLSVSRNSAGYWGDVLGEAASTLLLGDSTTARADDVEGESHMESHCLVVVSRGTFPEVSPKESLLDISPLNSYRGESIQSDQSEWVRQNIEVFSKQMRVSIEG